MSENVIEEDAYERGRRVLRESQDRRIYRAIEQLSYIREWTYLRRFFNRPYDLKKGRDFSLLEAEGIQLQYFGEVSDN